MLPILAILIPLLAGLLVSAVLIVQDGDWQERALVIFAAPPIGIALSSGLYFFWMLALRPSYAMPFFLALEGVLLLLAALFLGRRHRMKFKLTRPDWKAWRNPARWNLMTWVGVLGCLLLVISLANFLEDWALAFFASPDGGWDAWSIWNLHARFIDSGVTWRAGFTPTIIWWSHADYPLLLPAFIAQVWAFILNQSQLVPALVELCFLVCILGFLVSGVNMARGWKSAVFAGLFILPVLQSSLGFQQYADMPLAFFFLAANLFLWLADGPRKDQKGLLMLAGFMVGAAVWTKNEGWTLLVALGLVEVLRGFAEKPRLSDLLRRWLWLAIGLAPMVITTLVFKVLVAPPNDLVNAFHWQDMLPRLTDSTRYSQIWQSFTQDFFSIQILKGSIPFVLLVFVLVVGWNDVRKENLAVLWIGARVLIIGLVYFAIFVLDPLPLDWHLATSMTRLIVHLLPSLILMTFLLARSLKHLPEPT